MTATAMEDLLDNLKDAGVSVDIYGNGNGNGAGHDCEFFIPHTHGVEEDVEKRRAVRTKDLKLAALVLKNHYAQRGSLGSSVGELEEALRIMRAISWCRNFRDHREPIFVAPGRAEVVVQPLPWDD